MREINVGQELLNIPMGEMVKSLALGIAQAQWQLDKSSMTVAELMSGQRIVRDLDSGKLLPEGAKEPVIVDSRVWFGYNYVNENGKIKRVPQKVSMMELGFTPVFYQFVDTIIEVKISVSMTGTQEESKEEQTTTNTNTNSYEHSGSYSWWYYGSYRGRSQHKVEARTSTVDAKYSSKYSYSIEGSSLIRTKLVPVPPPSILEERIRLVMEDGEIWRDWLLNGAIKADGSVVTDRPGAETPKASDVSGATITLGAATKAGPGWTVSLPSGAGHTVAAVSGQKLILDSAVSDEDVKVIKDSQPEIALSPPALMRELPAG